MSGGMPELGSKISLISKADIRYEGRLYTVDPQECTIALSSVRSFGTEDRDTQFQIAPQSQIYEYILFRGSDIKDIRVINNLPHPNDPAIMQVQLQNGQQLMPHFPMPNINAPGPQMAPGSYPFGGMGGGLGAIGGAVGNSSGVGNPMAPGSGPGPGPFMMGNQQQQQQQKQPQSHQQQHQQKPQQSQHKQQEMSVLDMITGASRSTTPESPPPMMGMFKKPQQQHQQQQHHNQMQHHSNQNAGHGPNGGNKRQNQHQPQQQPQQRSGSNQQRSNEFYNQQQPQQQRSGGRIQANQQHQQQQQQQQQHQPHHDARNNYNNQRNNNQGGPMGGGPNRNWTMHRGNVPPNNVMMRNRGGGRGRMPNHQGFRQMGVPGGVNNKNNMRMLKTVIKFEQDFDFEQANNKFEELRSQLAKLKVGEEPKSEQINGETDKKDDSGNETGAGEHEHEDDEITVGYDKTKSFFDNISCETAQDRSKNKKNDWRQERKLNSETFGVSSTRRGSGNSFYSYRGRNNYYNRSIGNYNGGGNRGYRPSINYRNRNNNNRNNMVAATRDINNGDENTDNNNAATNATNTSKSQPAQQQSQTTGSASAAGGGGNSNTVTGGNPAKSTPATQGTNANTNNQPQVAAVGE